MAIPKPDPPRGLLRPPAPAPRADAEPAPFRHVRYQPVSTLAAWVEHVWIVRWDRRQEGPWRQNTLPHPAVQLTVEPEQPPLVYGVHNGRFTRELVGIGRVVGVKFRPGGFYPFWQQPVHTLTNRVVLLASVFGDAAASAYAQAIEAAGDDDHALVDAAMHWLLARCPEGADDATAAKVIALAERIAQERELVRVDDLAAATGHSVRMLQRLFRRYVGVGPKWLIQRYRLHEAVDRLADATATVDLAQLAAQLGYTDQAHFTRDFRAIVGQPPGTWARGG